MRPQLEWTEATNEAERATWADGLIAKCRQVGLGCDRDTAFGIEREFHSWKHDDPSFLNNGVARSVLLAQRCLAHIPNHHSAVMICCAWGWHSQAGISSVPSDHSGYLVQGKVSSMQSLASRDGDEWREGADSISEMLFLAAELHLVLLCSRDHVEAQGKLP